MVRGACEYVFIVNLEMNGRFIVLHMPDIRYSFFFIQVFFNDVHQYFDFYSEKKKDIFCCIDLFCKSSFLVQRK